MKRLLVSCIALVVLAGVLAGCGQKGPLYLPDSEEAKGRSKDRFEF